MASHFTPGSATAGSGIRVWCREAASTHLAQTLKFLLAIAIHSKIFYTERVAELCGVSRQLPSPFSQLPNHQVWSPPTHPLPAPANWLRQKKPHKIGWNKRLDWSPGDTHILEVTDPLGKVAPATPTTPNIWKSCLWVGDAHHNWYHIGHIFSIGCFQRWHIFQYFRPLIFPWFSVSAGAFQKWSIGKLAIWEISGSVGNAMIASKSWPNLSTPPRLIFGQSVIQQSISSRAWTMRSSKRFWPQWGHLTHPQSTHCLWRRGAYMVSKICRLLLREAIVNKKKIFVEKVSLILGWSRPCSWKKKLETWMH